MCLSKSLIFYYAPHGAAICPGVVSLCAGWCSHGRVVGALRHNVEVSRSIETVAQASYTLGDSGRRFWKGRRWVYRVCRKVNLQVFQGSHDEVV
jgi:hypothetical protein